MSHVFISYSIENQDYALKLANDLDEKGFNVWIDRKKLNTGTNWWRDIENAIASADAFIVIMTLDSYESENVQNEILLAKENNLGILPLYMGKKFSNLATRQYIDVSNGKLPQENFYNRLEHIIHHGPNVPYIEPEARRDIAYKILKYFFIFFLSSIIAFILYSLGTFINDALTPEPTATLQPPPTVTSSATTTPAPTVVYNSEGIPNIPPNFDYEPLTLYFGDDDLLDTYPSPVCTDREGIVGNASQARFEYRIISGSETWYYVYIDDNFSGYVSRSCNDNLKFDSPTLGFYPPLRYQYRDSGSENNQISVAGFPNGELTTYSINNTSVDIYRRYVVNGQIWYYITFRDITGLPLSGWLPQSSIILTSNIIEQIPLLGLSANTSGNIQGLAFFFNANAVREIIPPRTPLIISQEYISAEGENSYQVIFIDRGLNPPLRTAWLSVEDVILPQMSEDSRYITPYLVNVNLENKGFPSNIRHRPDTTPLSNVLGILRNNQTVTAYAQIAVNNADSPWLLIELPNHPDNFGWVSHTVLEGDYSDLPDANEIADFDTIFTIPSQAISSP